jgi:hypothetical protein
MGKKCIPGLICFENMTLFLFSFVVLLIVYFYFRFSTLENKYTQTLNTQLQRNIYPPLGRSLISPLASLSAIDDPYSPPLKTDGEFLPPSRVLYESQIPINIETRGLPLGYTQLGILTRDNNDNMILPLMGRRLMSGRDKWQYYTISNTGSLNTKLPIKIKGKNCISEYGCDPLYSGDTVFVEGYKDVFSATVYDNSLFSYIPV